MKQSKTDWLIFLLCSLLLSFSCNKNGDSDKEDDKATTLIPVEVSQVSEGTISAFLSGTATLEAEEEAEVVAKTSEIVKQIFVEEGMFVKKGQILAKLDDKMLAIEVEQAQADINKLENDFNRSKELFERNLISKEEFQNVRFQFEAQKATFKKAKLTLEYTNIRAPISGAIASRYIKTGNMINLNQPAFKIVSFNTLIAKLFIPEVEINKVKVGQKATLSLEATNGAAYHGYVQRISPVIDPKSGTVKVTVAIDAKDNNLKPGMFARIRIVYDTHENCMLIPKQAVFNEDGDELVFAVADSLATKKIIQTGFIDETSIEIIDGLTSGEQVVVVGQNGLKDSSKVEIIQ